MFLFISLMQSFNLNSKTRATVKKLANVQFCLLHCILAISSHLSHVQLAGKDSTPSFPVFRCGRPPQLANCSDESYIL